MRGALDDFHDRRRPPGAIPATVEAELADSEEVKLMRLRYCVTISKCFVPYYA